MRPTRREFFGVAAVVALGGAVPARRQDSRVPARFVGDAFERGHHWLTPDPEKLRVEKKEKKRVVIVGGGIAGVVAAWRLLEAGVEDFVLLELEDKAGGLARNGMIGSTVVPFGGITMAAPDEDTSSAVIRLLETAGVDRTPTRLSPRAFDGERWDHDWERLPKQTIGVGSDRMVSFDEVLERPASRPGSPGFEDRWCLFRYGARRRDISHAAFLIDARRWSEDVKGRRMALTIPGGFSALLAPLLPKIGERFLKARVVVLVKPEGEGARVRAVNALDAIVTDYESEAVVLAVPPFIARKIAPSIRERDKDLLLPETTPWLVTAFQVSEWPRGFDPSIPIHQTTDERATLIVTAGTPPEGVIVVHRPFPASAAVPARMLLRDFEPDEARAWSMREIAPVLPDLARVTKRVELWRVGHGSTRPAPGYLTKVAPRIRAPLGHVHPCGADYLGVPCVEAAIEDGVRGAEDVLRGIGKLDRSWL